MNCSKLENVQIQACFFLPSSDELVLIGDRTQGTSDLGSKINVSIRRHNKCMWLSDLNSQTILKSPI